MRGRIAASCALEERLAARDLVGLGVAVAGRAALQHVADVDVVARDSPSPRSSWSAAAPPCRRTARPARPRRRRAPRPRTPARRPGCRRRTRCSCAAAPACSAGSRRARRAATCRPAWPVRGFLPERAAGAAGAVTAGTAVASASPRRAPRFRRRGAAVAGAGCEITTPCSPDRPRASRFVRSWPTRARSSSTSPAASARVRSSAATGDPASACAAVALSGVTSASTASA